MASAQIIYTREQIQARVEELARTLQADLGRERPLLLAVLKGSVIFLADLVRAMGTDDPDVDFMSISSYPGGAAHTGVVRIIKDSEMPLYLRHVVLIEDIVDTGLTLAFLLNTLKMRQPASLRVCTFINKRQRRIVEPRIDYVGFETEDYVVGYGLDFKGRYRNLPHVVAVEDSDVLASSPRLLDELFSDAAR